MAVDPLFQLKSMLPHDGERNFWQQQNGLGADMVRQTATIPTQNRDKEKGPPAKAALILQP
jgi:hypothetical protein